MHTQENDQVLGWQPYNLDHYAQELVIQHRSKQNVLIESHKMRMTTSYGLERFWGEHLRYERDKKIDNQNKGKYWKAVWLTLAKILQPTGIILPDGEGEVTVNHPENAIKEIANEIWNMPREDQRVALMVLTQLCDSLVWWTQRYGK